MAAFTPIAVKEAIDNEKTGQDSVCHDRGSDQGGLERRNI
jgi:hypothetical protein